MTIIESANLSGHDPEAELADILIRIGDHKIDRRDELLWWTGRRSARKPRLGAVMEDGSMLRS